MKTLKEVVEECGFPVFITVNSGLGYDAVIIGPSVEFPDSYEFYGQIRNSDSTWFPQEDYLSAYGKDLSVIFYQALREDAPTFPTKKVDGFWQSKCSCPTLLNGHHAECQWSKQ